MQAAATNAATACCSPQNAVNFPQNGESARDYFKKLKFPNTLSKWADMQRAAETNTPISGPAPSARDSLHQVLPQLPLVLHLSALGRPPGFLLPLPGRLGCREEVIREFPVPGSREELRRRLDHLVFELARETRLPAGGKRTAADAR